MVPKTVELLRGRGQELLVVEEECAVHAERQRGLQKVSIMAEDVGSQHDFLKHFVTWLLIDCFRMKKSEVRHDVVPFRERDAVEVQWGVISDGAR